MRQRSHRFCLRLLKQERPNERENLLQPVNTEDRKENVTIVKEIAFALTAGESTNARTVEVQGFALTAEYGRNVRTVMVQKFVPTED